MTKQSMMSVAWLDKQHQNMLSVAWLDKQHQNMLSVAWLDAASNVMSISSMADHVLWMIIC
jgi:hypothetical protein